MKGRQTRGSRTPPEANEPAPGAPLDRNGLRRVLATLCLTELVSWGVLYYAFPVLVIDISADTGWNHTSLTAAFSGGLLTAAAIGIPVGRWLDRHGPRWIMTAGSMLAAPAVVVIATAPNLAVFAAGWIVAGVAMAAVLYPPAFTALTRWYGAQRVKALTLLTLAAGLASTVFAPATAALMERLDWRNTYLSLAVVLAVVTIPAHWWGLRGPWPARRPAAETVSAAAVRPGRTHPAHIERSLPFLAVVIAVGLTSFTAFAVVINLVPLLIEHGVDAGTAALALGLGGAGQVVGRIGYPLLIRHLGVRTRTTIILLATAATTALLGVLTATAMLIVCAVIAGMARGLLTLVQATAISDRWGTEHYGRLTGMLSAPVTVGVAVSPWAGAVIADATGGYPTAFLILAGLGLIGTAFGLVSVRGPT